MNWLWDVLEKEFTEDEKSRFLKVFLADVLFWQIYSEASLRTQTYFRRREATAGNTSAFAGYSEACEDFLTDLNQIRRPLSYYIRSGDQESCPPE